MAAATVMALLFAGVVPAAADGGQTLADCISDTIASNPPETPESSITALDCSAYTDVTSLEGIQALTGLTSVTIVGAPGADGDLGPLAGLDLSELSIQSFGITDPSVLQHFEGLQSLNVSGNHITDLTGVRACELVTATGQTIGLPGAVVGLPSALPAVTDTAGSPVAVTLSTSSAIAATIGATSVTWQSPGEGTLSWDTTYSRPDCGTVHFNGTVSQSVVAATPVPAVSSLSPREGSTSGGTAVTIRGAGFSGASAVTFGSTRARFTVNSDSLITATAPRSSTATGAPLPRVVDVVVQTSGGSSPSSAADRFTYLRPPDPIPAPVVTSISVTSGSTAGGGHVVIVGSHFTGATAVAFGDAPAASFTVVADDYIDAVVPAHPSGAETVSVTTPTGTGAGPSYGFLSPTRPVPARIVLSPASGTQLGGQVITVTGENLVNVIGVTVGGTSVPFTTPNANPARKTGSMTFVTPASAKANAVPVVVTTVVGSGSRSFQYQSAPAPSGIVLSPAHAPQLGGQTVTVTGRNIQNASSITIGGLSVPFQPVAPARPATATGVKADAKYSLVLPARAKAGAAKVVVTTIVGSGSGSFTFDAAKAPSQLKMRIAHSSQLGGDSVSLTGQNISNPSSVTIGGVEVAFTVQGTTASTAAGPGAALITFITPPTAKAGPVRVVVTTLLGSGSTNFTYDRAGPPSNLKMLPASASQLGGETVRLQGDNIANARSVTVGGVSVPFVLQSSAAAKTSGAATLEFTVPGAATPGATPVQVTTIVGKGKTTFTYIAAGAPASLRLSSRDGTQLGGQVLTLSGQNLQNATRVTVGGIPVTFTENRSSSKTAGAGPAIVFTTPGSATAGNAVVAVTTIVGSASIGYRYDVAPAPAKLRITPASGTQLGGEVVKISGENLDVVSRVTVGGVSVPFQRSAVLKGATSVGTLTVTMPGSPYSGGTAVVVTTIVGSGTVTFTYTQTGAS